MIISKFYNSLTPSQKEDVVVGLVWGLVLGLVWGLVWGSVGGLVLGLVVGLVWGLVVGLVWGLVVGLVGGLVVGLVVIISNWNEALPFLIQSYSIILLIIGIILLSEIMFWLMPKEKLKKGVNLFWHTAKRKIENIFEVLLGLSGIAQAYVLAREAKRDITITVAIWQEILRWVCYIEVGLIVLGIIICIFCIWIKLNSLKYADKRR